MPTINFDRLPTAIRPERRRLRAIQCFQIVLLLILGIFVFGKFIYKIIFEIFDNYFAPIDQFKKGIDINFASILLLAIIILCIREVYKGSHGHKWHFHGLLGLALLIGLLHDWYYGVLKHQPAVSAFSAGIMVEFFAYIALNKILSVAEERQFDELVTSISDVEKQLQPKEEA